jgi:acyl carrier protein
MSATPSIDNIVQQIVRSRVSGVIAGGALPGDAPLGANGLGLDSIAVAEVLLDCEHHFGVSLLVLLQGEPLTLTRLVTHLTQSLKEETPA